jgi:hypothetical protein
VIDRILRAYAVKDTTMISLIQQDSTFKKMSPDDVVGKIINHEMLVEEANMSKIYPKGSSPQRNKTLLSKQQRRARERKL